MRGVVLEHPQRMRGYDAKIPEPGPGEILVRIRRIGVCGTDFHAYQGVQPFFTYPRVLGHELAGEISAEGSFGTRTVTLLPYLECGSCQACRQGRPNCCVHLEVMGVHRDGGMQEWMTVPKDHVILSDRLDLDQLVIVEPLSIGAHAVSRAGLEQDERVLVIGAGPIGLAVSKFAKLAGAVVTVADVASARLDFCREWAPTDYAVQPGSDLLGAITTVFGDELPTTVFDATGNARSMMAALRCVAHGGCLIYVGLVQDDITFHDPFFHQREMTIMSSRNATRKDFLQVMQAMEQGHVDHHRFITHRTPLEALPEVLSDWMPPDSHIVKGIVEI